MHTLLALSMLLGCGDEDTDSGSPEAGSAGDADERDGTYEGDFTLAVYDGETLLDECQGTASFTFELALDTPIAGQVSCAFGGDLVQSFPDTYAGTADGFVGSGTEIYGSLEFDLAGNIVADDWTGSLTDAETMDNVFDGQVEIGGATYGYAGVIHAVR